MGDETQETMSANQPITKEEVKHTEKHMKAEYRKEPIALHTS